LTAVQPTIRYDALIEAVLNGTLRQAYAADKRVTADSTTLRKITVAARAEAAPSGPNVLVDRPEAKLLAQQARQRAEHAARRAQARGNQFGTVTKHVSSDNDAAALFKASRLRRIVPGFYAGVS
jgi:hypothetical protein